LRQVVLKAKMCHETPIFLLSLWPIMVRVSIRYKYILWMSVLWDIRKCALDMVVPLLHCQKTLTSFSQKNWERERERERELRWDERSWLLTVGCLIFGSPLDFAYGWKWSEMGNILIKKIHQRNMKYIF